MNCTSTQRRHIQRMEMGAFLAAQAGNFSDEFAYHIYGDEVRGFFLFMFN